MRVFELSLVTEGGRESEQTFEVTIQISNQTNPFLSATQGEDYRPLNLQVLFPPDRESIEWEFELFPNEKLEENEAFRATVVSSAESSGFPTFLTSSISTLTSTLIVIKDAQSKY